MIKPAIAELESKGFYVTENSLSLLPANHAHAGGPASRQQLLDADFCDIGREALPKGVDTCREATLAGPVVLQVRSPDLLWLDFFRALSLVDIAGSASARRGCRCAWTGTKGTVTVTEIETHRRRIRLQVR